MKNLLLLALALLSQSCVYYHAAPSTIDRVSTSGRKAKVVFKDGKQYEFKEIYMRDSIYYGVTAYQPTVKKFIIDPNNIQDIYIMDRRKSTTVSLAVGLGIGIPITVFLVFVLPFLIVNSSYP